MSTSPAAPRYSSPSPSPRVIRTDSSYTVQYQPHVLIAVSRGHIECAAILASDGRADTRIRDPVTGLTADQLAVTCTGYPLKRPAPDNTSGGGRRGVMRAALSTTAGRRDAGSVGPGNGGNEEVCLQTDADRKSYDATESSFRRRCLAPGIGRPLRRSSLPSLKMRFDDDLTPAGGTRVGGGRTSALGRGLSREQTTTTTVDDDD